MSIGKTIRLLLLFFTISLTTGITATAAVPTSMAEETVESPKSDVQEKIFPEDAPSEEVNYIQASPTAQEMRRAQKEHDAKTYDSMGGGISIVAMCIVIMSLVVLSILFMIFGRISSGFIKKKKKETVSKKSSKGSEALDDEDHAPDSGETIAAIAAALAQHFDRNHDFEATILTIQRMRKSYSPWNSKIYNMRHSPEVSHSSHPQIPKSKGNN